MDKRSKEFGHALFGVTPEQVQKQILDSLRERLKGLDKAVYSANGKPTVWALREQAAFMAGAGAALQSVIAPSNKDELTSYFNAGWVFKIFCGELLVGVPK